MKTHSDAELCLLVGDVVENGLKSHLGAVSDIFGPLGIPLYSQIGNHDYLSDEDRSGYEAVFPNRLNYWFEHHGWQFVGSIQLKEPNTRGQRFNQLRWNG
jgi:hypothetical protein